MIQEKIATSKANVYINFTESGIKELFPPFNNKLHFLISVVRCEGDTLSIYDGATDMTKLIDTYCNNHPPPEVVEASFNTMLLQLRSDGSGSGRGFYAVYTGLTFQETLKNSLVSPTATPDTGKERTRQTR